MSSETGPATGAGERIVGIDELPGPHPLPVLGNLLDIDSTAPMDGFLRMAKEYGPIYRLSMPSGSRLLLSGADLAQEVFDDTRFDKALGGGLAQLSAGPIGNGLFTSETDDPLWHRAHEILMAPFSMRAMRDYVPRMVDIAEQLMEKWARLNPGEEVDVPADMTRLTLDTIALCGFGYRFNSFYRDTPHPFVQAMTRVLTEAQGRQRQLPIQNRLRVRAQRQLEEDATFMSDLVDGLVRERRAQGEAADDTDLLGRMLVGRTRDGESLPDENIRAQCITFLIAGHETTSGLLAFAVYELLKNPEAAQRARDEVDEVLGDDAAPTFEQIGRLRYVRQVLDETLRLWPTAPGFTRTPREDTVIGGRYAIPAGTPITVLAGALHRDTSVWDDPERFDPDRMAADKVAALPPNAYKPFGTGQRACIGRQFALQEATLVLGMMLQRFELEDHLDYQLHTKTTLTVKPDEFRILVRPREGRALRAAPVATGTGATAAQEAVPVGAPEPLVTKHGTPLAVLFGSNLGTAEALATTLAGEGAVRGFDVTLGPLDDHVGGLPEKGAAVVVSSSYNGTPPDNAAAFSEWLAGPDARVPGTAFAVFGCGDSEWAGTYQAVPTRLDEGLAAAGGRRAHPRGAGDASADFDAAYRDWHAGLWAGLARSLDLPAEVGAELRHGPRLTVTLTNRQVTNPVVLSYHARPGRITANREMILGTDGKPPERSTRHVEIALPEGVTYGAGDHLGVLPRNGIDPIRRVIAHFGLDGAQYATIIPTGTAPTHLPVDEPAPLLGVLATCVELQDVATRGDVETLARYTGDPAVKAELEALAGDGYRAGVAEPYRSVLDLLEAFPACDLPFAEFLDLLPPLRPRYYSISSSPRAGNEDCSITVGVVRGPARSGSGVYRGTCSGHLSELPEQGTAFVFVRKPTIAFRPPADPSIPMIMVGAGTGLAPFRGFLQDRAADAAEGRTVGRSLLFFGCRSPEADELYADELRGLQEQGLVHLVPAYSRWAGGPRQYVQEAMLEHADEVWELLQQGAAVFVCGNASTIAPGVRAALRQVFRDRTGASEADADAWLAGLRAADRFLEDIWGSGTG
ncbi:cytochrome P450 [Pseudonocardia kujensis]|uniref:bifunctional cytochrome P450/NADPH--P450 reductase n=1 Tax=Pseudonocardia kujensis TaxID=1128675 RepID=UPI001E63AF9E|nr:cytochrome P450 [Pseudonocardia kujensis]MCE0762970.1 cytochrome P450 [Pseudonocardia kujensis]